MKIIFLDIDGVLNSQLFYESPRFKKEEQAKKCQDPSIERVDWEIYDIDPKAMGFLNDLIDKTGAHVVISSTWRNGRETKDLQELFEKAGLKGEIIGKTPICGYGYVRGNEILQWIKNNI